MTMQRYTTTPISSVLSGFERLAHLTHLTHLTRLAQAALATALAALATILTTILTTALVLASVLAPQSAHAQVQTFVVAPKTTDNRIDTALNDHYAFVNRGVARRNQLVVFFPGTGAEPRNYRLFPARAANLGFHAVGLMYPNDETVNGRCGALSADLDCQGDVRGETFDGRDRTPNITLSRANSIESRLVKLLQHLNRQNPQDNWSQYLERGASGDTLPLWRNIVVAGHSQGGGYAGYVAVVKRVARCIMFGAMDYNVAARRLANWMTGAKATPLGEFYAMGHERDELVNYTVLSTQAFAAYGLPANGVIPRADTLRTATAPFAPHRFFSTNLPSTALGAAITLAPLHNVPVVDANTPVESSGRPTFEPLWDYMLTAPMVTSVSEAPAQTSAQTSAQASAQANAQMSAQTSQQAASAAAFTLSAFPNPAQSAVSVIVSNSGSALTTGVEGSSMLTLTNALGQIVLAQRVTTASSVPASSTLTATLDVSSLPAGAYVLRMVNVAEKATAQMLWVIR
jgi:hypothetical protein